MTPQPSSTDLTSPVDNKLPVTTTTSQEESSPENPRLSEKAASEESKITLPSTRKETSPKDSKSTKPKKKTGFRFKGMGCKGLFSMLLCINIDDKVTRREKTPTEKPVTTTSTSTPILPSESVEPSTEEPTEGAVILRSESTSQPEGKPKPVVDDLIYSAASPDEPQKTVAKPEALLSKPSQTSLPESKPLLEPITEEFQEKKCLVLDLDETLVHSSFKLVEHPDFIVPVEIDNQVHNVYVAKRPGVDEFLKQVGELYEVVVFTASLSKYADPVLDMLDIHKVVKHRLFRESCYNHNGNYVKDLSQLGRNLGDTIIIDNSPTSYLFHPANAVPITTWFNDIHDTELLDLIPFLTDLTTVADVTKVLDNGLDEEEFA